MKKKLNIQLKRSFLIASIVSLAGISFTVMASEPTTFHLKKIVLKGNAHIPSETLEKLFEKQLNQKVSFSDLEKITKKITHAYRKKGYLLSKALLPAQSIQNGTVHIQVIEGHIAHYTVKTHRPEKHPLLKAYAQKIVNNKPTQLKILERYTLLANDLPGVKIQSLLTPSPQETGASELTFKGTEQRKSATLGLDNRGSKAIGRHQGFLTANIHSALRAGDTTGVKLFSSNLPKRMYFFNFLHQQPIGQEGTQFQISYSHSKSTPGLNFSPLNLIGKANILSTQLTHPLIRSEKLNFQGFVKLDLIQNSASLAQIEMFKDNLSSFRVGFNYNHVDAYRGINAAEFTFSKGLPLLKASSKNASNLSRANGNSQYTKITLDITRLQALPYRFSALIGMRGQYAFNPLLSAEEFSYGGASYGRAYHSSSLIGDQGLSAKLEIRYTQDLHLPKLRSANTPSTSSPSLEYYGFADHGIAWKPLPFSISSRKAKAASAGGGVRFNIQNFHSYLELATPLYTLKTSSDTQTKDLKIFYGLLYQF